MVFGIASITVAAMVVVVVVVVAMAVALSMTSAGFGFLLVSALAEPGVQKKTHPVISL